MGIPEILKLIPHRYPLLLIDNVLSIEPGISIRTIKNITVNEAGHFPEMPMMPSTLILEAMAQSLAILAVKTMQSQSQNIDPTKGSFFFAGINNANFIHQATPGDSLIIEIISPKTKRGFWKCSATASVDNKIICTADLIAAYKG